MSDHDSNPECPVYLTIMVPRKLRDALAVAAKMRRVKQNVLVIEWMEPRLTEELAALQKHRDAAQKLAEKSRAKTQRKAS